MMDVDEAFTTYVAQRRLQLFRTACLLCGDPHQAEDIVQDALARLYAAWPRASRADNIDAYVRRTIINSHRNQVRRPWRRERAVVDVCDSRRYLRTTGSRTRYSSARCT